MTKEVFESQPIPQMPWYLQIRKEIHKHPRAIDFCSVLDVIIMYDQQYFICDTCSRHLGNYCFQTTAGESMSNHMSHLINPMVMWVCEDCYQKEKREGRILGECD